MPIKSISCALIAQAFPADTVDPGFTITVVGTLADGSPFSDSKSSTALPFSYDFPAGTFQAIVSKLGAASQPSAPATFDVPTTVSISVPDATQAAAIE